MTDTLEDEPFDYELKIKRCLERNGIAWTDKLIAELYDIMSDFADDAVDARYPADDRS